MSIVVFMLYCVISALTFIEPDAYNKYKDFNDVQSYFIIAIKTSFALVQIYFYVKTAKKVKTEQVPFLE